MPNLTKYEGKNMIYGLNKNKNGKKALTFTPKQSTIVSNKVLSGTFVN